MSAFANHFSFEFRVGLRNRTLLLMNYLLPLGFYVLVGALMTEVNPWFRDAMIPAMVVFAILCGTLLSLPDPLVTAREAGIFRSYKVNGVPATSILSIPALTTGFHTLIVAAIITATAPLLFGAPLPVDWYGFALVLALTAFACAGIGTLIGVISASSRVTVLWSQSVYLPSMIIGGLMMPSSVLPEMLRRVALLLPATYATNGFQTIGQGVAADLDPLWSVLVLLSGGILAFGLSIYLFNWDSRNATRRGHPALAALALLPYAVGAILLP